MNLQDKIYIAGHRGLVGSALMRQLQAKGYNNLITRTHDELDLTDQSAVRDFFAAENPDYVFLAAAKVGGIHANNTYPAEFIYSNLTIQSNVIHEAYRGGVKRLLFLGSSCIYPRDCPQPMKEEYLLTGPLESTNRPYALAKIAGIEMCWAYNRQYGTRFMAVMPTNLYGPNDNYDLNNSHVLPALIRKMHEAKQRGDKEVVVWGTGTPRREFLYSDDMAEACLYLLEQPEEKLQSLFRDKQPPLVNVGCGEDLTIRELAELVRDVVGFPGNLTFDPSKPDGTMRKLLDVSRINALGWQRKVPLKEGIAFSYQDMLGKEEK
ncbi:MAG: GDP-L-fucose synthase [Proteobacteria bacterium]|nr:GDP-L-fucose synthase [Desulfocapsa sp.]MBU3943860.1 GDP-L-fucose synthase [Pseudomonadota bacterium]MCG2745770.1 GDP-L-fucose synthase [Desulfobacteraceae bacterium]MBU4027991.1 GDP-L-fucose synthase [Pseudomonadota bacterium]MBU4041462.1 GDP-L-fucose synthase [Pseudomonadota bacterium]